MVPEEVIRTINFVDDDAKPKTPLDACPPMETKRSSNMSMYTEQLREKLNGVSNMMHQWKECYQMVSHKLLNVMGPVTESNSELSPEITPTRITEADITNDAVNIVVKNSTGGVKKILNSSKDNMKLANNELSPDFGEAGAHKIKEADITKGAVDTVMKNTICSAKKRLNSDKNNMKSVIKDMGSVRKSLVSVQKHMDSVKKNLVTNDEVSEKNLQPKRKVGMARYFLLFIVSELTLLWCSYVIGQHHGMLRYRQAQEAMKFRAKIY
ncbi:hypothetical protein M8J76_009285 [Diaphorina citri]|nr:hypothetical protein M8J75_006159 [Diaphorina citri]KAI5737006.1 hypothetical protein M8J76_009285 [Diaphorina citri]